MKKILVIVLTLLLVKAALSQSIYFPAIGDGAQNPKTEYGYLESVPVEIRGENIDTLFCNKIKTSAGSGSRSVKQKKNVFRISIAIYFCHFFFSCTNYVNFAMIYFQYINFYLLKRLTKNNICLCEK